MDRGLPVQQLSSLDLSDEVSLLRDRIYGLRCAIAGASIANGTDRAGLLRLIEDLADAAEGICRAAGELEKCSVIP